MAEKGWAYGTKAAQEATLHTRRAKDEPGRIELAALAEAAGGAVTDLRRYTAWQKRAESTIAEGDGLLSDEGRYGVHLDRVAGAREQAGAPLDDLRRALGVDGDARERLAAVEALTEERDRRLGTAPLDRVVGLPDWRGRAEAVRKLLLAHGERFALRPAG